MTKNKRAVWMLACLCLTAVSYAQQADMQLYQQAAGDFAALYQGRLEDEIVQRIWADTPYLDTAEFRKGTICFNGVEYQDVPIRYNAQDKLVVVMSPGRNAKVVPDQTRIQWFTLDGRRFVPNPATGGFSREVYAGQHVSLLYYLYKYEGVHEVRMGKVLGTFAENHHFYLQHDGVQTVVSSLRHIAKLFPQQAPQLRQYCKQHRLKFNAKNREASLARCVSYLDTLIR